MSHHVLEITSSVLSLFFVFHFLWIFVSYFVEVCLLEKKEEVHVPKGTQGVPKKEIYKVEKLRSHGLSYFIFYLFRQVKEGWKVLRQFWWRIYDHRKAPCMIKVAVASCHRAHLVSVSYLNLKCTCTLCTLCN